MPPSLTAQLVKLLDAYNSAKVNHHPIVAAKLWRQVMEIVEACDERDCDHENLHKVPCGKAAQ